MGVNLRRGRGKVWGAPRPPGLPQTLRGAWTGDTASSGGEGPQLSAPAWPPHPSFSRSNTAGSTHCTHTLPAAFAGGNTGLFLPSGRF